MDPEKEEANPFESPTAKVTGTDQGHWWALWIATGLVAALAVACAFSKSPILLPFLILLVGIPSLLRTTFDLSRKQSAGWIIDAGVQVLSFCTSLAISIFVALAGSIAGFTVCFAEATVSFSLNLVSNKVFFVFIGVSAIAGLTAAAGLFYRLGPRSVRELTKQSASDDAGRDPAKDADESEPAS